MARVLELLDETDVPAFCRTAAAADIQRAIETAMLLECLGIVVGAPGVGKTMTLLDFAARTRGAVYCVMDPAQSSTMPSMLALLSGALGVPAPGRCNSLHQIICNKLKWGRFKVVLIDEAQQLNDRCLDELRCIHDQTGVPFVFAGNESFRDRCNRTRAAAFAQFTSRIGARADLPLSAAADVAALARHAGVHEPRAIAYLEKWSAGASGLREIATLLRLARMAAGAGDIKLAHVKEAASIAGTAQ